MDASRRRLTALRDGAPWPRGGGPDPERGRPGGSPEAGKLRTGEGVSDALNQRVRRGRAGRWNVASVLGLDSSDVLQRAVGEDGAGGSSRSVRWAGRSWLDLIVPHGVAV